MGYYVIPDSQSVPMESFYVENYADIALIEGISGKSIICSGSIDDRPVRIEESPEFSKLGKEWYIAGAKAQFMFAAMARQRRYIVEEIRQDQASFQDYQRAVQLPVKRGDFLIRNLGNLEIEVKCRTFYQEQGEEFFYFSKEDLEKHANMQYCTQTPVIIAVFQRKGQQVLKDTLCMIKIDQLKKLESTLKIEVKEYGLVYRIPLKETVPGFGILDEYGDDYSWNPPTARLYTDAKQVNEVRETVDPRVLIVYYKSDEHLNWIIKEGLYNIRKDSILKRFGLAEGIKGVKYLLLHTEKELFTDKIFEVVDGEPALWTGQDLVAKNYPSEPTCYAYWVYQIRSVETFQGKCWNLRSFSERVSKFPKMINCSELLAEAIQVGKVRLEYPHNNLGWTSEEDIVLKQMVDDEVPLEVIAKHFKRKPSAIYLRIEKTKLRKRK